MRRPNLGQPKEMNLLPQVVQRMKMLSLDYSRDIKLFPQILPRIQSWNSFIFMIRTPHGLVNSITSFWPKLLLNFHKGIECNEANTRSLMLRDYGRYESLIPGLQYRASPRSIHRVQTEQRLETCYPGLVSFISLTSAGKSPLVKSLISLNASENPESTPSIPIAEAPFRDLLRSTDIHLNADPRTVASNGPILYADCERPDGNEKESSAATSRRVGRSSPNIGDLKVPKDSWSHFGREIYWANSTSKRTRDFAVTHLYPRILFTFSDVVVFVHRNPRS
jgi:hypothetical protein